MLLEERQRALRTLLARPLLTVAANPEALTLVRRHADWLRDWLGRNVEWQLYVDSEAARLRKRPMDYDDSTRPAVDFRSGAPFTRRRYVFFCLVLAALEGAERQTVLGQIAENVVSFAAADSALAEAGIEVDLNHQDQRRDLVYAVRLLIDLGVIVRIDGEEAEYLADTGDVLYNIERVPLTTLLNVSRGPSTIDAVVLMDRLKAIANEVTPASDEARNRRIRTRLTARLLDDPVLYFDDLDEAELAYLKTQRPHLLREIEDATGLVAEVRSEGIAMVDPRGDVTDVAMPQEGTDGHLALLLAEWLAEQVRDAAETRPLVGLAAIRARIAELILEYGKYWRKEVREPGAEMPLAEQAIDRLEALRLVQRVEGGVVIYPAIGRYALDAPREAGRTAPDADRPSQLWEDQA
ncbi:MAG: TIGR02678 family protein [Phycisphaeraceae bacterium]